MPNRRKENFKEHKGKHVYVSPNYQRDWSLTEEKTLLVKSKIELEQGNNVETSIEIPLSEEDLSDNEDV